MVAFTTFTRTGNTYTYQFDEFLTSNDLKIKELAGIFKKAWLHDSLITFLLTEKEFHSKASGDFFTTLFDKEVSEEHFKNYPLEVIVSSKDYVEACLSGATDND